MIKIAPSLLSADFARLGDETKAVDAAGADYIHIDVMDGHFVPNITIGADVLKSIKPYSQKPFDVHLMIENADFFVPQFANAGADIITVHPETGFHLHRTISLIKSFGKKAGVALNPSTPVSLIENVIEDLDLVLIMTVNPGFGGQSFISPMLPKIEQAKLLIDSKGKNIELEVDGGINAETAKLVYDKGATLLVAGSYVFKDGPEQYKTKIDALKNSCKK